MTTTGRHTGYTPSEDIIARQELHGCEICLIGSVVQ